MSEKYVSSSGSPIKEHFEGQLTEKGIIKLVKTGVDNLYLKIQAERDSCDVNLLIKRFQAGDPSALDRVNFFYADVSGAPKSPSELLNLVRGAEDEFNHLPLEKRQAFDNDFNKYFSTMNSKEWFEKMSVDPSAQISIEKDSISVSNDEVKE